MQKQKKLFIINFLHSTSLRQMDSEKLIFFFFHHDLSAYLCAEVPRLVFHQRTFNLEARRKTDSSGFHTNSRYIPEHQRKRTKYAA